MELEPEGREFCRGTDPLIATKEPPYTANQPGHRIPPSCDFGLMPQLRARCDAHHKKALSADEVIDGGGQCLSWEPRYSINLGECPQRQAVQGPFATGASPATGPAVSALPPNRRHDRHLGPRPISQLNTWPVVSCERFTSALAGRRASLGVGRMASPYPMGDFHLLFFASLPGALRVGVIRVILTVCPRLPVLHRLC